jgi:hypothetical protein
MQATTGLTAQHNEASFCYWMTVASSGLAYVVAVWCLFGLGRPLRLSMTGRLALTASFALCTMAPAYARHVNNHILLLGVTAPLVLTAAWMGRENRWGPVRLCHPLVLGALAGLAYTIDLGAGPVILLATLGLVAYRCRRFQAVAAFGMAALPWLVLHHAVNYAVGGTLGPANAVAEYFQWPGCPFNEETMTGGWKHANVGAFLLYAAGLLDGKRGFLGHNLPLLLALTAIVRLLVRRTRDLPETVFAGCMCGGTWLLYAACSNNSSGLCCSIRWFVPLIAPGYYVLALWIRDEPNGLQELLILSGFGAILAGFMWWEGPWMQHLIKVYWPVQALALVAWAIAVWRRGRRDSAVLPQADNELFNAAA